MGNSKNSTARDINAANRASLAIKLRTSKMTYDAIAKQCGYADRATCFKAIQREMERVITTNVEELRNEELLLLDALQSECHALAFDPQNDKRLFAIDRLLNISERRSKLMGLDVPVVNNVAVSQVVVREVPSGYLGSEVKP